MVYEYAHNHISGATVYHVSFNAEGKAFLSDGESVEVWGTGGRIAADYAVEWEEIGNSGHYVGNSNVTSGNMVVQRICVYVQAGEDPANSDLPIGQGERSVTDFMIWAVVTTGRSV